MSSDFIAYISFYTNPSVVDMIYSSHDFISTFQLHEIEDVAARYRMTVSNSYTITAQTPGIVSGMIARKISDNFLIPILNISHVSPTCQIQEDPLRVARMSVEKKW